MVLPLIVTALSIICLLIATSTKNAGKGPIFLSIVISILVIHSAHDIFLEIENRNEDHRNLVDASFTLLYIPIFYLAQQVIFFQGKITVLTKLILGLTVMLAVFLYCLVTFQPSMPLYCYASLIWSAGCLAMVMLWQRLLILTLENRKKIKFDENFKSVHLICFQIMIPFLVPLLCAVVPEDNFILPYQPFFTIGKTISIVEITLWMIMIIHIYNVKKSYDTAHSKTATDVPRFSGTT